MSSGPCSVPLTTPWQVLPKPLLCGNLGGFSWAPILPTRPVPFSPLQGPHSRRRWDISMNRGRALETVIGSVRGWEIAMGHRLGET